MIWLVVIAVLAIAWVIADALAGTVEQIEAGEMHHWCNGQYARCEDQECACNTTEGNGR